MVDAPTPKAGKEDEPRITAGLQPAPAQAGPDEAQQAALRDLAARIGAGARPATEEPTASTAPAKGQANAVPRGRT